MSGFIRRREVGRREALRVIGAGAAVGSCLLAPPQTLTAAVAAEDGMEIVGSWLIRSGPPDRQLPVTSLITYTSDGTCVQTTTNHQRRSPAMGRWIRVGDREFAVTFVAFAFDEQGRFAAVSQVRVQSTLDETLDAYTGRFESFTLDDEANAVRLDGSGIVQATRVGLARLE